MGEAAQEFRHGWRIVLGASFGVGLGVSGLLTYNMGLFAADLEREIGLSRTAYGAAFLGSTLALAAAMPVVGRLVDRYGPRPVAAVGAVSLAVGFAALSRVPSVAAYCGLLVLIGFFASPSSPVPHTRAVAGAFARSRGLALGFTQVGIGAAAAFVPPFIGQQVAERGWQAGMVSLSVLALCGLVPVLFGLPGRAGRAKVAGEPSAEVFAMVRDSPAYRLQLAAFATMALAFAGMLSHFVPMLRDGGMSAAQSGAVAGMIGLSVIATRVIVGWLSDLIEPAWLGAASCAVCAAGCLALALGASPIIGALALGAAMGAEADLIGILTARNFALPAYSRAYARQYATFMIAGGISPLWIGFVADLTGSYRMPLLLCAAMLTVPIALFVLLPWAKASQRGQRTMRASET